LKVATFNVNSIRLRSGIVLDWLAEHEPDVLVLQETKCEDSKFPVDEFSDLGWNVVMQGQKTFNGVAILSRHSILNVRTGLEDPLMPEDCRLIRAEIGPLKIINTYVPNGTEVGSEKFRYKLGWLARFKQLIAESYRPSDLVVWLGDINIAPKPEDVYDSKRSFGGVGHHPDEFCALDSILEWGWTDCFRKFEPEGGHFSFWEFVIPRSVERNLGWRIDHIYASPGLADACTSCRIDKQPRLEVKPSDHTIVVAEFDV
jgi:exodeoxyribonuclease III